MKKIFTLAALSLCLVLAAAAAASAQATKNPLNVTLDNAAGNAIRPDVDAPYRNGFEGVGARLDDTGNLNLDVRYTKGVKRKITLDFSRPAVVSGTNCKTQTSWELPFGKDADGTQITSGPVNAYISSRVQPSNIGGLVTLQAGAADADSGMGIGFPDPLGRSNVTWSFIFAPNDRAGACTTFVKARRLTADPAGSWQLQGYNDPVNSLYTIGLLYSETGSGKTKTTTFHGYYYAPFLMTLVRQ